MTAVTYSDGTERDQSLTNEASEVLWISPATMDSNNTVTPPARTGKTIRVISCWDNTTGDAVTASVAAGVVTIDAAGGTTDHSYLLKFCYIDT